MRHVAKILLSVGLFAGIASENLHALPFNTDMYNPQPMTGSIMRPRVPDTVPLGSLQWRVATKEEAQKLKNPIKGDPISTANGGRLYSVNCAPCHGSYGKNGSYTPSWFADRMPAPDLSAPMYSDQGADSPGMGRSDGNIYGTIHLGGLAIMPAYGWKLSPTEHWDIINYLRSLQEAKRQGGAK